MNTEAVKTGLPSPSEMYRASCEKDSRYDGVFFLGVTTTGIFCRPTCPARKPLEKNVQYFPDAAGALAAGFRPCKRCRPLEVAGRQPRWLEDLIEQLERQPHRKLKDQDIRNLGVDPKRVRRWFQQNHGITFHSYLRSRRLARALGLLSLGDEPAHVALDAGYESLSGFYDAFQKWCGVTPARAADRQPEMLLVNRYLSPLGPIILVADSHSLYLAEFADRRMLETQFKKLIKLTQQTICPGENKIMGQAAKELESYFAGKRQHFEIPLAMPGSAFQTQVWKQLQQIPFGQTTSYDTIAGRIGNPNAQRAVGRANGENRLAIIVPCHRVIRSDGTLSGYGGGVRRKEWLLQLEAATAPVV